MRVRFYIESRRGEDGLLLTRRRPIFMTVAFNGNRVLIATGKHVDLSWWDKEKQRLSEMHPESGEINGWLDGLAFTASAVWKALASLSEKPGANEFREEFEKLRPRFSGGFFDVMLLFMEEGSNRWNRRTYLKVRTCYNQLKDFEKSEDYVMNFKSVNDNFISLFQRFSEKKKQSGYTLLKSVNILVWFLNWATEKGYNVYRDYKKFYKILSLKPVKEVRVPLYLEWEELMKFYDFTTDHTRKERCCDLFCLMCFTGLRFTEITELKKSDVGEKTITIRKKERKIREVPLNKYSKAILLKYSNRWYRENAAMPSVSMITLNKYLKEIVKECGISRKVQHPLNPENRISIDQLITAGMAVQTFIMNALKLDIPVEVIASFTGVNRDQRVILLKQELAKSEMEKFNKI